MSILFESKLCKFTIIENVQPEFKTLSKTFKIKGEWDGAESNVFTDSRTQFAMDGPWVQPRYKVWRHQQKCWTGL